MLRIQLIHDSVFRNSDLHDDQGTTSGTIGFVLFSVAQMGIAWFCCRRVEYRDDAYDVSNTLVVRCDSIPIESDDGKKYSFSDSTRSQTFDSQTSVQPNVSAKFGIKDRKFIGGRTEVRLVSPPIYYDEYVVSPPNFPTIVFQDPDDQNESSTVILEVRSCNRGTPMLPVAHVDGGVGWTMDDERTARFSLRGYLLTMLKFFRSDLDIEVSGMLDGMLLLPYQAVVRSCDVQIVYHALCKPFMEQRSAYRRVLGGRNAPDIFFGVSPKYSTSHGADWILTGKKYTVPVARTFIEIPIDRPGSRRRAHSAPERLIDRSDDWSEHEASV